MCLCLRKSQEVKVNNMEKDKDWKYWWVSFKPTQEQIEQIYKLFNEKINVTFGRVSSENREKVTIDDSVTSLMNLIHSHVGELNCNEDMFGIDSCEQAIIEPNKNGGINVTLYDDYNEF